MHSSNVNCCFENVTTTNTAVVAHATGMGYGHSVSNLVRRQGNTLPPMNYGYGPYGQQNYSYGEFL